jgi:hypothetical protein
MDTRARRLARLETAAGDILTYHEVAGLGLQLLDLFRAAMLRHIDDPVVIGELIDEMTDDANRVLGPTTGYGIGWRLP